METALGSSILYVIYPHKPEKTAKISGDESSVIVEVNGQKEIITLSGEVKINVNGKESVLLEKEKLPELGKISSKAEDIIRVKK